MKWLAPGNLMKKPPFVYWVIAWNPIVVWISKQTFLTMVPHSRRGVQHPGSCPLEPGLLRTLCCKTRSTYPNRIPSAHIQGYTEIILLSSLWGVLQIKAYFAWVYGSFLGYIGTAQRCLYCTSDVGSGSRAVLLMPGYYRHSY